MDNLHHLQSEDRVLNRNFIKLDNIGIVPPSVEELTEKLSIVENITFSSIDEVVSYLKRRQNIFTYALEGFGRAKETNEPAIVKILGSNMGWEKKQDGKMVNSLRDDAEAMFTAKDLCTLASVAVISFLKDALKDHEEAEVHLLKVSAKKKTTEFNEIAENEAEIFNHNIVYVKIGDEELVIDPTYRQIDSEYADPFLFVTVMEELSNIYVPNEEGYPAELADNQTGNQKTMSGITDDQEKYFQRVLRVSD